MRGDPWDRIDLAFLPGDVDGDGTTNSDDYDKLLDYQQGEPYPNVDVVDMNRDGSFSAQDKSRLEQLMTGTRSSRAWNNISLPVQP